MVVSRYSGFLHYLQLASPKYDRKCDKVPNTAGVIAFDHSADTASKINHIYQLTANTQFGSLASLATYI